MYRNYFTTAFRNILKNKVFSFINVLGLAIGISASLVIYLLVSYHFSFDQFEKDRNRIYRVVSDFTFSGESYHNSGVTMPLPGAVRREVPGLEVVAPFYTWDSYTKLSVPVAGSSRRTEFRRQSGIIFADSNYFRLFQYKWLAGAPRTALLRPYDVVLTKKKAALYFPGLRPEEAIGHDLYLNDTVHARVSGVVDDLQYNTDLDFGLFVSRATMEETSLRPDSWDNWSNTNGASQLYVKLAPTTLTSQVERNIEAIVKANEKRDPNDTGKSKHSLQALSDIHFNNDYGGYNLPLANKPTLFGLIAVASFLLLLGCINFVNLTTAYASQRAKEIGIRKTMGGSRAQLMIQFLSETFLLTLLATLLSVVLTPLILKAFAGFMPDGLHFDLARQPQILAFLFVLLVGVSLLSGIYPAVVLSGFRPVLVIKNQAYANTGKTRKAWLRKSLTVSQFVIAQVFIMATILVSKQISYSINKDQGFRKEAIVYMNTNYYDTVRSNKNVLAERLRAIPGIALVSLCNNPPSSNSTWSGTMKFVDGKKELENDVQQKFGDSNYLRLYGLRLQAGTDLPASDTVNAFLINETYARILGFTNPSLAIGKSILWSNKNVRIAGVVADFNQGSLHAPIKPLTIARWENVERNISILLKPQQPGSKSWKEVIGKIETEWKRVYPKDEFEISFFDEEIAKYYTAEQHISSLLVWATGLAVFISCLGLLGLAIYTTGQRTKEIGVRKVLGASVSQIVGMISSEFILLVGLAFVVAAPLALLGMNRWLQNFAYRTTVSWWIFFVGGVGMVLVALLTLSFQTVRAATANPVKSLRTE